MRCFGQRAWTKWVVIVLIGAMIGSITTSAVQPRVSFAEEQKLSDQIIGDLVGAGISVGAALTGNVPLAFLAGYLTKYITTYGIAGIKSLIDYFKGYRPKDLGEINLYYIYLLNVKRELYYSMITIRKSVHGDPAMANLEQELSRIESTLSNECQASNGCTPVGLDYSLINYAFLNIILDAKETVEVSKYLSAKQLKNTYHYLILLYLDTILIEQKLVEAQANVLVNRTLETVDLLDGNPYLSNEEKEYQTQLLIGMALRWYNMADMRRVVIAEAIKKPLADLQKDNAQLQEEIDKYKNRKPFKTLISNMAKSQVDESYNDYLKSIAADMRQAGIAVDVYSQNPFQTGTALSGYFLGEKTLLLERDAFFQMKANKLQTTGEIADYQYRTEVLRSHGNNMLLQLVQAVDERNREGFVSVEKPKHEVEIDKIIEECKKDAKCVTERLENPETSLKNIILDNFALATQIFGQIPYMHALEVNSTYQLIQLIYLEVFYSQNLISRVEFDVFLEKQRNLKEVIANNQELTESERKLHEEMVKNTVNQWKRRILERRFDHRDEFRSKALDLKASNAELFTSLESLRSSRHDVFGNMYQEESCFTLNIFSEKFRKRQSCKNKKRLGKIISDSARGSMYFMEKQAKELPKQFWDGV